MIKEGSFRSAIEGLTEPMGYVLIDEDNPTNNQFEQEAHNQIFSDAQDFLLYKAAKHQCPIWIVVFSYGMAFSAMQNAGPPKPSDRVAEAFGQARLKLPAAHVTFVRKNEAYPFGNSFPPLEDDLKRSRLSNFVYMGFHTNACVRAAAVGPKGNEGKLPGAADKFGHTIWTCREILRGDQGNADWKDHERVNFYNSL